MLGPSYQARIGEKVHVIVGDKRGAGFDEVFGPVSNADGSKVAFGARDDRNLWWKVIEVR